MKFNEFLLESKTYKALSMAKRAADKLGHKVVKSDDGYFTTAYHDDSRPELVPNPYRTEIEPRLKAELKKLKQEKLDFLKLKAKVASGFLYGKEYKDMVSDDKWRDIKRRLTLLNKQIKGLPKRYTEVYSPRKTALQKIIEAIKENKWTLLESSFGVQFLKCSEFDKTFAELTEKEKSKLNDFINFKKGSPLQNYKKDTYFISDGPIQRANPTARLKHAHLTQDKSIVYNVSGSDPIVIKLYGVYSHDDLGTGNTAKINIQKSKGKTFSMQSFYPLREPISEESPDTLEGSFTQDLVDSKMWLCNKLTRLLKEKSAGDIYVLGSWYGNLGLILQETNINFNKLVLVETNKHCLDESKKLLSSLHDEGRLELLHEDAANIEYKTPCTIINCSTDDMDTDWLTRVPNNALILIQGRNNVEDVPTRIPNLEKFDDLFPLRRVLFLGEIPLEDPETKYTRFMKIGFK